MYKFHSNASFKFICALIEIDKYCLLNSFKLNSLKYCTAIFRDSKKMTDK